MFFLNCGRVFEFCQPLLRANYHGHRKWQLTHQRAQKALGAKYTKLMTAPSYIIIFNFSFSTELEKEVAKQFEAKLPILKRRTSSLKGLKKSVIFSETILETDEDGDSDDVFAGEYDDDIDPEELEDAFDHFLDKLESLVKHELSVLQTF